jgi:glutathione reductase (NADPH)
MWHAADIADKVRHAANYQFSGTGVVSPEFGWKAFKAQRDAYILKLNGIYDNNLVKDHVEQHRGRARLTSPNTIQVEKADGTKYEMNAKHVCIAVGGYPTVPSDNDIPGASLGINSDGFFALKEQPKRVAVVGAGYIAVELAGVLHTLGSETHLIIRGERVLRSFDPMLQDTLTGWMEHTGLNVHKQSKVVKVEGVKGQTLTVHTDKGEMLEVDTLLWAIGRQSSTMDLGLEDVGVKLTEKGDIVVDEFQKTTVENIFALGDCIGKWQLTPVAIAAGRRLSNRLFGPPQFKDDKLVYENIPTVVFSHPPIGTIGFTEPAARKKYGDDAVKIYKSSFRALYFSMIDEEHKEPSVHKLIVVGEEERVVGMHIIGMGSDEITQGFGVAMKMGARKRDFDDCVAIHPTSAEELVTLK